MENNEKSLQYTSKVAIPFFVLLLILSVVFYRYRVFYMDPSAVLYTTINREGFNISEHRYGAFITQMFPVIGSILQLPIKGIIISYSASFYLFYLTVICLLYFRYKASKLALLLTFYFSLIVSDNFFWPNNEVHQGMGWIFLFFGIILQRKKITVLGHLIAMVCLFLGMFSHFLVLPILLFLWVIFWLNREEAQISHRESIFYSIIMAIIFGVKLSLSSSTSYDGEKLKNILHPTLKMVLNSFTNGHSQSISKLFITNYWIVLILLGVGIFSLVKEKKYLLSFLTVGACIIYYALVSLTYVDSFTRDWQFYMETEWMPITILATFPFVYNVLDKIKPSHTIILLCLILSVRLGYIFNAKELFAKRYKNFELVCNKMREKGETKISMLKTPATDAAFLVDWGTPTESIVYSAMEGIHPQITFKMKKDSGLVNIPNTVFINSFSYIEASKLNPNYFHIDTTRPYKVMSLEDIKK